MVGGDSIAAHKRRKHTALSRKARFFRDDSLYSLCPRIATVIFDAGQRPEALCRGASPLPESEMQMTTRSLQPNRHLLIVAFLTTLTLLGATLGTATSSQVSDEKPDQVLEWNQVFIDTLIATNTSNAASQRLGAIVHTAIFDAYNGIERRYSPVFMHDEAPRGASLRAAVIAAAYTALVRLFPTREPQLTSRYYASVEALSDDDEEGGRSRDRGILWGSQVAEAVLAWRQSDFTPEPPFNWRHRRWPVADDGELQSAGGHDGAVAASTDMFILDGNRQFQPAPPRSLLSEPYLADFDAVRMLGGAAGSNRNDKQTALAPSGKETRAFIGTRPPTSWRAPTIRPCPAIAACWRC